MTGALSRTRDALGGEALGALVAAGLSVLLGRAVAGLAPQAVVVVLGMSLFAWALVALPVRLLPAFALLSFALLPVADGPHAKELRLASPCFVAIAVWIVRAVVSQRVNLRCELAPASLVLAGTFAAATILSHNPRSSAFFSVVVGSALVLCPLVAGPQVLDGDAFRRAFLAAGAVLGLAAVAERYVLHSNPVFDSFYAQANPPVVRQHWEVYRATTSLGHPLVNGAFFAATLAIAAAGWMRHRGVSSLLCAAAALGGMLASGSRSAFVAAGCGVLIAVLAERVGLARARGWPSRLAAAGAVSTAGWLAAAKVVHARASTASAASEAYHRSVFQSGWSIIRHAPFLGYGPNQAWHAQEGAYGVALRLPLESMWLEVGVAMGVAGLAALGWWTVRTAAALYRSRSVDALAAFVTLLVAMSFFNAFEGQTPLVLLLGLVAAAGLGRVRGREAASAS